MHRRTRPAVSVAAVAAVFVVSSTVCDPAAAADPAAAQLLFEEAKAARDRGDWTEACRKFAASMKLDLSLGTLLNVAQCHTREGKLATAVGAYERARVMNRATPDSAAKRDIEAHIETSIAALRPRLPLLAVAVTPVLRGLEIVRNDAPLPVEALEEELPVDPGDVHVRATAPGYAGQAHLRIGEAEHKRIVVTMQPTAAADSVDHSSTRAPTEGATGDSDDGSVPAWAWVSGALGIAFVGAAIGSAVWYSSTVDSMTEQCGGELVPCRPDPAGSYDPSDDNRTKNLAMGLGIAFGITGAVGVATAIIGIATAGGDATGSTALSVRVQGHPQGAGLEARVRF